MPEANQKNVLLPILPRKRLDQLFDAAIQTPFVVVQAGGGFGKTTAASDYLSRTDHRIVKFSFTMQDNISARFWAHLTRVFSFHQPVLKEKMQALGFPSTFQAFGVFLAELTELLYQDKRMVVFVFDDLHLLTDPVVENFLKSLILSQLENSCILLLSRIKPFTNPPIPIIPYSICAADLLFTQEETREYLVASGVELDWESVKQLHGYVSGWPIALSLAALSLKRAGANKLKPVENTTIGHTKTALFALFEQEIFSEYTPHEQDLLCKLSILESFPLGLVQAVTGEHHRDLTQLLAHNLFIRYDSQLKRLYFHPFYQEFLRERLRGVNREAQIDSYEAAAQWCLNHAYYYDAANYYMHCGNFEKLWTTLQYIDATRHNQCDADFFIHTIRHMPRRFIEENPMTQVVLAVMLMNNLRFHEAQAVLDELRGQLDGARQTPAKQALLGEYWIARGFLTLAREENGFEAHFQRASGLLPNGSARWDGKLQLIDLGPGLNLQSAQPDALQQSLACFAQGVPYMVRVLHGTGQGLDQLCRAEAGFLTGALRDAIKPAYQAFYEAQAAAQHDIAGNALLILMRIYLALGDYELLMDTLERVDRYKAEKEAQVLGIWDLIWGWFYAEMGAVDQVSLWIRDPAHMDFAPISVERTLLVRLRCLMVAGQYHEALALLASFEERARQKHAVISLLYVHLGYAVAYDALGDRDSAYPAFEEAYHLAQANNLQTPFVEYGTRTRTMIGHFEQIQGQTIPNEWLSKIRTKASTYAKRHSYISKKYEEKQQGQTTRYQLSRRETELLTNLSQGLTREEISAVMQLSINTVKSLTKQVFAKLGAINTPDAVRIAIVNQLI